MLPIFFTQLFLLLLFWCWGKMWPLHSLTGFATFTLNFQQISSDMHNLFQISWPKLDSKFSYFSDNSIQHYRGGSPQYPEKMNNEKPISGFKREGSMIHYAVESGVVQLLNITQDRQKCHQINLKSHPPLWMRARCFSLKVGTLSGTLQTYMCAHTHAHTQHFWLVLNYTLQISWWQN